jgi:hypothetical protein
MRHGKRCGEKGKMRQRKYCATAGVLPLVSLLFLPLGVHADGPKLLNAGMIGSVSNIADRTVPSGGGPWVVRNRAHLRWTRRRHSGHGRRNGRRAAEPGWRFRAA